MKPLAIITGVGPGTGASLVRRFAAGGYRVAIVRDDARGPHPNPCSDE